MRMIIVGAGPAGLFLAHALTRLGMTDFVILEKRQSLDEESGNGLGLWPQSVRVLDQLGLLEAAQSVSEPLKRNIHLDSRGTLLAEEAFFTVVEKNHGHPFIIFERTQLLKLLYDNLPELSDKVMTAKEIKLLRQDDEQVEVICGDGTSYTGDILIGADGVYSAVRRLLFLETPGTIPFTACYKGVLGMSMTVPGVEVGAMVEIHFRNLNLQYLATSELTYWFIWTPRETPSRSRTRYTQSELEENVKVCADVPLSPNSKAYFASLWRTKKRAVLADIEEGILKQWYKDRTVLVGDSCHKTNPHLGFGANNCVESAVALANNLRRLQTDVEQQGRANPSIHQIKKAFATYQKERYSRAKWTIDMSAFYAGLSNWNNLLSELVTRHLLPHMGWLIANYLFAPTLRNGIVLEAIGEPHYKTGKVKWKYGKAQIDTSCH